MSNDSSSSAESTSSFKGSSSTCNSKKRPRPSESLYDNFICPICLEYLTPPVIRCSKDHNFCQTCIERMEINSNGNRCPICRLFVDKTNRNRFVEELLSQSFLECEWKSLGCKKQIPLSDREKHSKICEFQPKTIECYYSIEETIENCSWVGSPYGILEHLKNFHSCETIERETSVRFLWNIPTENVMRMRPRGLKMKYPSTGTDFSYFVLEHLYLPQYKMALFLVRSLDPDVKIKYYIDLLNRTNDNNGLTFRAITLDFKDFRISDYPNVDKKMVFQVPYDLLESFSFISPEDEKVYFSFHVIFDVNQEVQNQSE